MSVRKKTKSAKSKVKQSDYVIINGVRYERVSNNSVELELELHEDVLSALDVLVSNGRYVSRGDAIRDILRQEFRDKCKPK